MAPRSGSNSRGKRAKTSSSVTDAEAANNLDSSSPAGSSPPVFQTPPAPTPTLRRSLRLSATSASASNSPNPKLSATSGSGSTSATHGSSGKRKANLGGDREKHSVLNETEIEEEAGIGTRTGTECRVEIMAGEGSHMPANQDQHQQQLVEVEFRDADGDGKESTLEGRLLSLGSTAGADRDKGKGKDKDTLIKDVVSQGTTSIVISRFMDKGKDKMVVDKASDSTSLLELSFDSDSDSDSSTREEHVLGEEIGVAQLGIPPAVPAPVPMPMPVPVPVPHLRREAQRNRAIELAPKFAFFKDDEPTDSEDEADDESLPDAGAHDWPGPFSTAMKIIEEREVILRARQEGHSSKASQPTAVPISWTPSGDRRRDDNSFSKKPPSLKSLCIKVLTDNAHEIESLGALPDMVKNILVPILCHSRKMTAHHLSELVRGSPVELKLSDCSWATDKEFEGIFTHCGASELKELQLDLCGRCLPDYILRSSLARAPNSLPSLTKLSLKGAYSLSNDGLAAIISSAPLLSSLNLCQCSLLTSEGIIHLTNNKGPALRELYLDNCQNVNAMSILPSLKKAECLEVLSMAGIPSMSDKFVRELIPVCGSTIKELNFAGCSKLTSSAMRVIGENCPQLFALDIRNLTRLKDVALGYLANGCRDISRLLLCRSSFSDEAIAAFVEASGTKLIELSINNIDKVGHQTAIAISTRCCMSLQKLDLSFCRRMSDQALGLMVDSCSYLKILKLFGCTQVTDVFLKGHSNVSVQIIGLDGNVLGDTQNLEFL